jgi:hypothetical protein
MGGEVVHRGRSIVMVHARLRAPFWNYLLELVGDRGERVYLTPHWGWSRKDIRDLEARGYTLSYVTRWTV